MLSGSLDAFGLEEVLRFMSAARVTGRVDVVRTRVAGSILLADGLVVGASRTEARTVDPDDALDAAADLFEGSGGAFVLSRLEEAPQRVIDLDLRSFFAEIERRLQARAASDLLRELTDGRANAVPAAGQGAPVPARPHPSGGAAAPPIHLDRPPVRVLTREEQRMRLRL